MNERNIERRRQERVNVSLEGCIKPKNSNKSFKVWINNLSILGMKLLFYKNFYCGDCLISQEKVFNNPYCSKCEIYDLEKIKDLFKEGVISVELDREAIKQNYQMKWFKIDDSKIEFGIEFVL